MAVTQEEFDKLKKELEDFKKAKEPVTAAQREASINAKKEEAQLQERIAIAVGDVQDANRASLQIQLQLIDQLNLRERAITDLNNLTEEEKKIVEEIQKMTGDTVGSVEDLNNMQANLNKKLEISNKEGKKYRNTFESIATHIGMSNKGAALFLRKTKSLAEELKNNKEKQEEFARAFVSTFNGINAVSAVFTAMGEAIVKNLVALDKVASNFAAATGAGRGFTGTIQEAQANSRAFGVTLEESGAATQALFEGFIGFTNASNATQTSLAETTSQLSKFGVEGATAVDILNFLTVNVGKSAEEAERLTKQIAMMGPAIGISTSKFTRDFNAALPSLAVYGDKAIDVFQGLAGAARMAGVETSKMLDLANKFDTFSEGAETAGKLNAILGTQISSMELLTMKEDERIESLIRSVQATGVAFNDLGRYEQKAIATAAGISDLNEAQKIFSMSMADFQSQQMEMDQAAEVQEKFNKTLKDLVPLQQKFMLLFSRFVPLVTPALELLHDLANGLGDLLDKMSPEMQRAIGLIVFSLSGLVVALSAVAPLLSTIASLGAGLKSIGVIGPVASVGLKGVGQGIKSIGAAVGNPKVILGIFALTAALYGAAMAYDLYQSQTTKQEEAKARQAEANIELAETFAALGDNFAALSDSSFEKPIAGLQLMATALGKFQDVDVDARATLTNLALISAGKASDSANNARIISAGAAQINNNISNSFAPKMVLRVGDKDMSVFVEEIIVEKNNSAG